MEKRTTKAWSKITAALLLFSSVLQAQDVTNADPNIPKTDSLARVFSNALANFSPPQLIERRELLRSHQQQGYASTLMGALSGDGLFALISYVRTRLQIEYSMPRGGILVDIAAPRFSSHHQNMPNLQSQSRFRFYQPEAPNRPEEILLDIDWSFPSDPWEKD